MAIANANSEKKLHTKFWMCMKKKSNGTKLFSLLVFIQR